MHQLYLFSLCEVFKIMRSKSHRDLKEFNSRHQKLEHDEKYPNHTPYTKLMCWAPGKLQKNSSTEQQSLKFTGKRGLSKDLENVIKLEQFI